MKKRILIVCLMIFLIAQVSALDQSKKNRIDFGHVLTVTEVSVEPDNLIPGNPGVLKMVIENNANFPLYDIRIQMNLPDEIFFLSDVSKRKIYKMLSGESEEIYYNITASPDISEGIYNASFTIEYLNHVATEREEADDFGIMVRATPKMFAQIEESEIYKGNDIGDVTVKFINNDLADISFLTVELQESEDYKIISNKKEYVGDLDSDDFESVNFRIKVESKKEEIVLPLKITYKDSINNDYSDELGVVLFIYSAEELGVSSNGTIRNIVITVLILIIGFYFYRRYKKKKRMRERFK